MKGGGGGQEKETQGPKDKKEVVIEKNHVLLPGQTSLTYEGQHFCAVLVADPARCCTSNWSVGSISFIAVLMLHAYRHFSNVMCKDITTQI